MKTKSFFINALIGLALVGLLFIGHADGQTNAVMDAATNGISTNADGSPQNYFGLPTIAFGRLTPDQIMELAQSHGNKSRVEPEAIMALLVPFALFAFIAVCVGMGINARLKRNRMMHETIRLMVEKGQPIPPELLQPQDQYKPTSDLRRGLIWCGVGIGLGTLLLVQADRDWPVALIPLLIGVAFLITWKFDANKNGLPK